MKKKIYNALALAAIVCGFAASMTAPWWAVWFAIFPVIFVAAVYLIKSNTKWMEEA